MRKSFKNEGKEFIWNLIYSVSITEAGVFLANRYWGYEIDYIGPLVLAIGVTSINRLSTMRGKKQTSFTVGNTNHTKGGFSFLQSITKWSNGSYNSSNYPPTYRTKTIKYKDPVFNELFWDVDLPERLEPIRVKEDELHTFVTSVSKRQRNRLHPFSRNYFKRQYKEVKYDAMIKILEYSHLIDNRSQGCSGELITINPYAIMWQVKTTFNLLDDNEIGNFRERRELSH